MKLVDFYHEGFSDYCLHLYCYCPPTFFRCLANSVTFRELRTTSFIESTGVACSDSVNHTSIKYSCYLPIVRIEPATSRLSSLKLREPMPTTITPCVLRDNSDWIFGTYKLNVLTWQELLLLCMNFYLCSYTDFFRQTYEEGCRTYRPKRCGNSNKDEDNSPKTLNDKNIYIYISVCVRVCDVYFFQHKFLFHLLE